MQKSQKIWLWIPAALFFLPEILWNPLVNFLYSFFMPIINGSSQILRDNFLLNSGFEFLYLLILLVQLVGAIVFTVNWVRFKSNLKSSSNYFTVLIFSILLTIINISVVFLAYAVSKISFP